MAAETEHDQMTSRIRHSLAIVGAASALALAGCFSGSSSSSGDGDSDNGGDDSNWGESDVFMTLDRLSGLGVEETRDELLFYKIGGTGGGLGGGELRAIHPDDPLDYTTFDIQVSAAQLQTTTPVISGDWDEDDFDLTGIERELIAAKIDVDGPLSDDGVATIRTGPSSAGDPDAAEKIGQQQFLNAAAGVGFVGVTQSPGNIDAAQLFVGIEDDNFFYNPGMNDGDTVPSVSSEQALGRSLVSIRDIANLEPIGWVAVQPDPLDGNTLQFLDMQGDLVDNIIVEDSGTAAFAVDGVSKFGEILPDGSYYLVIEDEGNSVAELQLRLYTPDADDGAGTVEVVTDDADNVVDMEEFIGSGFLGSVGAQSNRVAYGDDGALFFSGEPGFFSGVTGNSLYRVEGTTLETVFTSGDSVLTSPDSDVLFRAPDSIIWMTDEGEEIWKVSLDGADAELIADGETFRDDFDTGLVSLREYRTPVRAVHEDGWLFYTAENRFDEVAAVIHNIETGELRAIAGAEWVGSSSDGSLGPAGFLGEGRLSEVFLMKTDDSGDPILGAVDAADPLAGMVELGALPAGTEFVEQGHIGSQGADFLGQEAFATGPHRLFRAELEGDQNGQIIYVDVNEKGSLEPIVNSASPHSYPVSGY
ncbi:hypothetical protein ACNSTU_00235 [Aquisalimonas sp. APHAB1-3]|uniref:hypothetical protein n=1 Tax=Aquisalimonas sp. APHAB1-3 TaxID=3402080 RepID=UPI003AAF8FD0